jgi:hypothetical protein
MNETMKKIFIFFIPILFAGCNHAKDFFCGDPEDPILNFTVTDSSGNDLFFGENSQYNAEGAKYSRIVHLHYENSDSFEIKQTDWYSIPVSKISDNNQCFSMVGFWDGTVFFEFIPGDIDTLIFIQNKIYRFSECYDTVVFDAYFNDSLICIECSLSETFKFVKQ